MKLVWMVVMVLVLGSAMRYGQRYILKASGMPVAETPQFSSEEADLMTTVFKSALRLFSGSASRNELSSELSDKLYAGRDTATMSELGIELVKPGASPAPPEAGGSGAKLPVGADVPNSQPGATLPAKQGVAASKQPLAVHPSSDDRRDAMLARVWAQAKANSLEFSLVPVVLLGMILVQRMRGRSKADDFLLPAMPNLEPAETEPYAMKHAVHSLTAEDFELLVALIYQRQGYRVSMPAGLGGGRNGDFTLLRKSERLLVQCKRLNQDHKVPVERVRELHEAAFAAGATRAMYVASCSFSWDARNFAKAKGVTLINSRTLDALITAAREKPDEDLLAVSQWAPKLMSKAQLTTPECPACEAEMEQISVSAGSVWVCSQRPDCRGRRSARKYQKPAPPSARNTDKLADEVGA